MLKTWIRENLIVRDDCYGTYYWNAAQQRMTGTAKKDPITDALLDEHLEGRRTIGLYVVGTNNLCKWLLADLDQHDESAPPEVIECNDKFAHHIIKQIEGDSTLLFDSNGMGGRHILIPLREPTDAATVQRYGQYLIRDWESFGFERAPEVFPKQASIKEGGFGNWVRLFGKHHTYDHWTRVWDAAQQRWLDWGEEAWNIILRAEPLASIPDYAPEPLRAVPDVGEPPIGSKAPARKVASETNNAWLKQFKGDLRTLDIKGCLNELDLYLGDNGDGSLTIRCPWGDEHSNGDTTASVKTATDDFYPIFNCFHAHCEGRRIKDLLEWIGAATVDKHCKKPYKQAGGSVVALDNLQDTLSKFLAFLKLNSINIKYYRDDFYRWTGTHYELFPNDCLFKIINDWLEGCLMRGRRNDGSALVPLKFNPKNIEDLIKLLKPKVLVPASFEVPCWLSAGDNPHVIAFENCLFDIERKSTLEHSPDYFSMNCLPRPYDAGADCPKWLRFLDEIFEGDTERIESLQQFMGYLLTSDTSLQKGLMFVGRSRDGKSTTQNVIRKMVGAHNVASASLTSLAGRFGLHPLLNATLALIPDAHLGRADGVPVMETLKKIIGEDSVSIDRKNRDVLPSVRLRTRFLIATNELPRFSDASNAINTRFIVIPFERTFLGEEDYDLEGALEGELPGITNWAMKTLGVRRIYQPSKGLPYLEDMERLSSPVSDFLEDCCEVGAGLWIDTADLFREWRKWCEDNGHQAGSNADFGRKLRAHNPHIEKSRYRKPSTQERSYKYNYIYVYTDKERAPEPNDVDEPF